MTTSDDPAVPRTGLRLVGRMLRRHRRRLVLGYPLVILWQLCETLVPVLIGVVIDRAVDGGSPRTLLWTLGVLAITFAVLTNAYRFGVRLVVVSAETESHLLRLEIAGHVLHPRGARTERLAGETLSYATSDAHLVPLVLHQLGYALASLASLLVVAVYVLQVDVTLGLLILLGVPGVLLVIQAITPLVARRTRSQQESTAAASGLAGDVLQGLRPLKGVGGEDVATSRYRAVSRRAQDDTIAVARSWGYLAGLTTGLSGVLLAAVAVVAGTRALEGAITLGELVALVGLTQFLAEPIRSLGDLSAQFAGCRAAAARIVEFLHTPRLLAAGTREPSVPSPQLDLRSVRAGGLEDLTLRTRPGELVALAVDDPAVSDVVVELLAGERHAESGTARLGDVDLADLSVEARRRLLLVADHHAEVFEGTLRSTVDPRGTRTDGELAPVLAASAADEVVGLHPDALDRTVRARGTTLSGGQRQRLALARAVAADAPLLVLQDPTSAVDAVTEQVVADGLRTVRGGDRTTILLTSSPALLQRADRVLVVRGGRLVAEGTHADLLLTDPLYREAVLR